MHVHFRVAPRRMPVRRGEAWRRRHLMLLLRVRFTNGNFQQQYHYRLFGSAGLQPWGRHVCAAVAGFRIVIRGDTGCAAVVERIDGGGERGADPVHRPGAGRRRSRGVRVLPNATADGVAGMKQMSEYRYLVPFSRKY